MKLLIVESPSKAKTISKYLGKGYVVRASVGHVRDLPKSNKDAVDIEGGFKPKYVVVPKKKDVISDLKKEAKKADEILLATDPDREGEAIAWHVAQVLEVGNQKSKDKRQKIKRVVFNEITKEAVLEALEHPRDIDEDLLRAQEARRVLDRLVGYDLSGLIWKKVRYGLSAGRVQSPALRILAEREREIRAFIPEDYWVITADLSQKGKKNPITFTCVEEPRDKKLVEKIVETGKTSDWTVSDIEEKEVQRKPYAPFKTSTLQQTASSRLGFSPGRTMRIAQKLYEAGLITYMRTDSYALSAGAHKQVLGVVEKGFGKEYVESRVYSTKSKTAQEAHEAIRPTDVTKKNAGATEEQKKLYSLIWTRTVASQMKPAKLLRTKITASFSNELPPFTVNGSQTLFPGWLICDTRARGEDVELPKMEKEEPLDLHEINTEDKQTQPPNRYTEAGLVKELEKREIGRPSTYSSIIETLVKRGYVNKEGRTLFPTDTGMVVSSFLEENFTKYVSDDFTAEMEEELDEIACGDREYAKTLKDFYSEFSKDVESKQDIPKLTDLGPAPKEFKCPECGSEMIMKLGKTGTFMSCSRFPDCKGSRTNEGEVIGDEEPIGTDPETNLPVFVLMGPYGPYVQLGEKNEENKKPKRASIPKDKEPDDVTIEDALKYLSLPRTLGTHPETGENIQANIGRFGPYIALMSKPKPDYRSLKEDDPYTITLERALEILKEPKKTRGAKKSSKKKK